MKGVSYLAGCGVVAQTQGYYLVCFGVAWLIAGGGVVLTFEVFNSYCCADCFGPFGCKQ